MLTHVIRSYERFTRVYERSGKNFLVQYGGREALHVENIIIYNLYKSILWMELLTCAETCEGIERREDYRHLVVLVRQLVPNIEGLPNLIFVQGFDFPVQFLRLQKQILQSFCGLFGLLGVGDGDGSRFHSVR